MFLQFNRKATESTIYPTKGFSSPIYPCDLQELKFTMNKNAQLAFIIETSPRGSSTQSLEGSVTHHTANSSPQIHSIVNIGKTILLCPEIPRTRNNVNIETVFRKWSQDQKRQIFIKTQESRCLRVQNHKSHNL